MSSRGSNHHRGQNAARKRPGAIRQNINVAIPLSSAATFTPGEFSLDLSVNPNFQGITGVTFRVYRVFDNPQNFSTTQKGSLRLDNLQINGTVVPGPASVLLLTAAGALVMLFRRRRR